MRKTLLLTQNDHRRDWIQAGPCVGYESFDHPQQEQMLQLNQQKQWLGQARLGHADMEANPQEFFKKNQSGGPGEDCVQGSSEGGAQA